MCQPSASSAIEPKIVPPAISATIMAAARPRGYAHAWGRLFLQVGLDRAFELDGQRIALAVDRLADRDPDPAFADAILLDVGLFLAVELDADALLQQRLVVKRALGVGREAVGKRCV